MTDLTNIAQETGIRDPMALLIETFGPPDPNYVFSYKVLREKEYPPITDYIDGVVKGDQAQIDAYIAACQAVKAKYPKPE